ncbi:MAG: hypothetical protein EXQ85_08735 [Alphaproteobacteria bacterium]|nr:hypothetical protein [Alphaproteobacteria bacterium]
MSLISPRRGHNRRHPKASGLQAALHDPGVVIPHKAVSNTELDMSVSPHEKKKFGDYARIHAVDGEIISREDETAVLKEGIARFGLDLDEARGVLFGIADDHDITLVSAVENHVSMLLEHSVKKNRVARKLFSEAVAVYRRLTKGRIPDDQIRKRVKHIVLEHGWKARKSRWLIGSRRWFRKI